MSMATKIDTRHEEKRQNLYSTIDRFWHDLNGEPYALYDVYAMTYQEIKALKEITEKIVSVYDKTAELLRIMPDESLIQLGIPELSLPYLRRKALPTKSIIRRLDLVKTKDGWKHFEINADTPTFIKECYHVNAIVAKHFGFHDANGGTQKQLSEAIRSAIFQSHTGDFFPKVVFTAHDTHEEDWNTSHYLGELSKIPHEIIALDKLRILKNVGLFTPNGEKIDVLYRQTYPIEFLVEDQSEQGTFVGVELMKLVNQGKLAVINPLSAFLLQSKAVQALIWGLHEVSHDFFSVEEHDTIQKHFIPTYLDNEVFLERRKKYVTKPVFGREGDTVVIFDEIGNVSNQTPNKTYDNQLKVYQEYVELPKSEVMTPYGKYESYLLFGSFIIGNEASAIGIRAGRKITGNEAWFLPIGIMR